MARADRTAFCVAGVAIAALAAQRGNRAWHLDTISAPLRDRARALANPVVDQDGVVDIKATGRRMWVADLLKCPDCTGFHLSWMFTLLWIFRRTRWIPMAWAAATLAGPLYSAERVARGRAGEWLSLHGYA